MSPARQDNPVTANNIQVRFFASLREQTGIGETSLPFSHDLTVSEVWQQVCTDQPMPANTLMAVNMEYVDSDFKVAQGDEVAFFPPVTGG